MPLLLTEDRRKTFAMWLPQISPNTMNSIQAASWVIGVTGVLVGIIKILIEFRETRLQRDRELRWKKAEAAKSLNDELLSDPEASAALTILDWDGREFEVVKDVKAPITHDLMLAAVRTVNLEFSDAEMFVRDAFDNLFYYLGIFEHYISRGLVDFMDVEQPIAYYVKLLSKHHAIFELYLTNYGFGLAAAFLKRFESWRSAGAKPGEPHPNRRLVRNAE